MLHIDNKRYPNQKYNYVKYTLKVVLNYVLAFNLISSKYWLKFFSWMFCVLNGFNIAEFLY